MKPALRTLVTLALGILLSASLASRGGGDSTSNSADSSENLDRKADVGGTFDVLPAMLWVRQLGVSGKGTYAAAAVIDAAGNMYVTGTTDGGLDGNTLRGRSDFFLTKFDSAGQKIYTRQYGAANASSEAVGVAVDSMGNVYVAGTTNGNLDLEVFIDYENLFLIKYNSAGEKLYTRQIGVAEAKTYATGVAIDAQENVYVTGYTDGGLSSSTGREMSVFFLAKYDAAGNRLYASQLGLAEAITRATGIAVDAEGNVYVTGSTYGGLDGNTLAGYSDSFLAKYDAAGNKLYTRQLGVRGAYTWASGIAVDTAGNVYVTGETDGALDGNAKTGSADAFLTKYTTAGEKLYTRLLGIAETHTYGTGVAVDAKENVYVTGYTDGTPLAAGPDFFLARYDASGKHLFIRQPEAASAPAYAEGVAVDAKGNIYVTGSTGGGLDGNTLSGSADFFLAKYGSDDPTDTASTP